MQTIRTCTRCGVELSHGTMRPKGSREPLCLACRTPTTPAPASLPELAAQIRATAARDHKHLAKARMECEFQGKQRPRKAQSPPGGLFEQKQESLL